MTNHFDGTIMKKFILLITLTFLIITSCEENKVKEVKKLKETSEINEKSLVISSTWMRPGSKNRNTASFMNIKNNTDIDDTLFSVQSDLAKVVELHETYEKENDMMGMRHVDHIIIPKKSTVQLKPGSFHIMLIGLNNELRKSDSGKVILNFRQNGSVEIPINAK